MSVKTFLPKTTEPEPFVSKNIYKPNYKLMQMEEGNDVYISPIKVSTKCSNILGKLLPFLAFLSVTFGTVAIGFSTQVIGTDCIGYYQNDTTYYPSGIYLQLPWRKADMLIANIGTKSFIYTDQSDMTLDGFSFTIDNIIVEYNVCDVNKYVSILRLYRGEANFQKHFSALLLSKVIVYLKETELTSILSNTTLSVDITNISHTGICVSFVKYNALNQRKIELHSKSPTNRNRRHAIKYVNNNYEQRFFDAKKFQELLDYIDTYIKNNLTSTRSQEVFSYLEPKVRRKKN